jgi:hypothetical protein
LKIWIARARAPISSARVVWGTSIVGAVRDLLDGRGDDRKRPRDRAGDDQHADHDHAERQAAEAGQHNSQFVVGIGPLRQSLAAFGIDLRKRVEVLVERGPHLAVGVAVAPLAPGGRTDLDATANQLLAEVDELVDPFAENGELRGIIGLDQLLPACDHGHKLFVELEQPFAELAGAGFVRRHVDAAGFHDDRVNQRIDALDVERGAAGRPDGIHQFGAAAGVVVR